MKFIFGMLTAAILAAGVASAQPPPPGTPPPPGRGDRLHQLGLNPEQTRKVQDVLKQFGPKMRDLEKTLAERRKALEGLYAQFNLDTGQARQLNIQINGVQKEILEHHLKLQVELRKILTAEQFGKMRDGMQRRRPQEERHGPPWQR